MKPISRRSLLAGAAGIAALTIPGTAALAKIAVETPDLPQPPQEISPSVFRYWESLGYLHNIPDDLKPHAAVLYENQVAYCKSEAFTRTLSGELARLNGGTPPSEDEIWDRRQRFVTRSLNTVRKLLRDSPLFKLVKLQAVCMTTPPSPLFCQNPRPLWNTTGRIPVMGLFTMRDGSVNFYDRWPYRYPHQKTDWFYSEELEPTVTSLYMGSFLADEACRLPAQSYYIRDCKGLSWVLSKERERRRIDWMTARPQLLPSLGILGIDISNNKFPYTPVGEFEGVPVCFDHSASPDGMVRFGSKEDGHTLHVSVPIVLHSIEPDHLYPQPGAVRLRLCSQYGWESGNAARYYLAYW